MVKRQSCIFVCLLQLPSFLNNDSLQFLTSSPSSSCSLLPLFVYASLSLFFFLGFPHLNIYLPFVYKHISFKFTCCVFESRACYIAKRNCAFLRCCHLCHVKKNTEKKTLKNLRQEIIPSFWRHRSADKLFRVLNEISKEPHNLGKRRVPEFVVCAMALKRKWYQKYTKNRKPVYSRFKNPFCYPCRAPNQQRPLQKSEKIEKHLNSAGCFIKDFQSRLFP